MAQPKNDAMFTSRWGQREWWGRCVELSTEAYAALVREIEVGKAKAALALQGLEDHTSSCDTRYAAIEKSLDFIIKLAVGILLALLGWMAVQLWQPVSEIAHSQPPAVVSAGATHAGNP